MICLSKKNKRKIKKSGYAAEEAPEIENFGLQ